MGILLIYEFPHLYFQIIVCDERHTVIPTETVIPIKNVGDSNYAIVQPGNNKPDRTRSFRIERINNGFDKTNSYHIGGTGSKTEKAGSFRVDRTSFSPDPRSSHIQTNGYQDTPTESNVTYNLIRQPSLRKAKKIQSDPTGGFKVDTYSVGVIMSTAVIKTITLK